MFAPHECTALSSLGTSLSAVGAFFTLNRIPTRHNRSRQDATNGSPPLKSVIIRSSISHAGLHTAYVPATLHGDDTCDAWRVTHIVYALRECMASHLYHAPRCLCRLTQFVSLATCALVPNTTHCERRRKATKVVSLICWLWHVTTCSMAHVHAPLHGNCACGVCIDDKLPHMCAP